MYSTVLTFVTAMEGPQQLEFPRRSWIGMLVKERQVTARSESSKKFGSFSAVRENFST